MKRSREERNTVKGIIKLIDDIITPETLRAYKAWERGYITADEARIEIANCLLREAIEAPHNRALEIYTSRNA